MSRAKLTVLFGSLFLALTFVIGVVNWYSDGIALNQSVVAQYSQNQNIYDTFWKKVKEVAQVPERYKDDFKDLIVAETTAKFGPEGSKAAFQFFHDRNLAFDGALYGRLQTVIEAGRNDFQRGQQELLDKQRRAATHQKSAWGSVAGIFANPFKEIQGVNKPPKDLDGDGLLTIFDYNIVTSATTSAAFESGEVEALKVF